jgi:two-component system NtrC family sensor kinase
LAKYGKFAVADDAMTKRGRKTTRPKRRNASKVVHGRNSSIAKLQEQLDARTRELGEALEQQTATSRVLRVISSSPADTQPVFKTIAESAARLCDAQYCYVYRFDGTLIHVGWFHGHTLEVAETARKAYPMAPGRGSAAARSIVSGAVEEIPDVLADVDYAHSSYAKIMHYRSIVAVPMLKDGRPIGAIAVPRSQIGRFPERQIQLLQTFADQAVIAIENVRLFEAEQQRTRELSESLDQQTATSEVLRVISTSAGELRPIFDAMLLNAVRLCEAKFAMLFLYEGNDFRAVCTLDVPRAWSEWLAKNPIPTHPRIPMARAASTKKPVHVADARTDQAYLEGLPGMVGFVELGGGRTLLQVPMLQENEVVGMIGIFRQEVRAFADKQIALVENFAAQAVIAIENTRLLNELRQSLEQQTATSEVLRVISASPGELEPVFQAMLENATRICEARFGVMFRYDGEAYEFAAEVGTPPALAAFVRQRGRFLPGPNTQLHHVLQTKAVSHTDDYAAVAPDAPPPRLGGARSTVDVPMFKDGALVGVISIYRQEVRPFTDKQIALVQNFAAQAVIAIENTRLLNELRQRSTDLSQSLDDLRTAQDRLVQTEKLASLGQLTAGIAHEIKNPLNFVNNFSSVSVELIDELREALTAAPLDQELRAEIGEIADTLQGNLGKILQHGKRADAIVKNMLLHSREGSGEHRPVEINTLVEESLNLAYHGARAEKQGFNITLERSFDPAAGEVDLFPQEITRVLLNLISNGFYAATKRKAEADGGDYEPTVAAATKNLGRSVEIRIRDNGTGIPPEVKEKMFNPFFTTKPAGEGTGLGLSISHDIIVKQHGGSIEVDTKPGEFTEFRIVLPRGAATIAKAGERA